MKDLFGELLVKIIPFIIPAALVASFMMNHKTASGRQTGQQKSAQGNEVTKQSSIKSAPAQTQTQAKETVETEAVDAGDVAGKIAEFASRAVGGNKSEDPYKDAE